ncbi:hypothetical protein ES288_D09G189300v1 [Gossypium darwinii]|uniref:Uncharacterized protein n=1 Tax=Gossypium darwinii TaxID=34276 RepID=A0A5D2BAR0_GOSDA|nr:hypothetical protein ES288_D09G189300v1 [Gossypium darwinii]
MTIPTVKKVSSKKLISFSSISPLVSSFSSHRITSFSTNQHHHYLFCSSTEIHKFKNTHRKEKKRKMKTLQHEFSWYIKIINQYCLDRTRPTRRLSHLFRFENRYIK